MRKIKKLIQYKIKLNRFTKTMNYRAIYRFLIQNEFEINLKSLAPCMYNVDINQTFYASKKVLQVRLFKNNLTY